MTLGRKKCIEDTIWPLKLATGGFQETKKVVFSRNYLKNLMVNRNFEWNFLSSIGSTGGILVGVDVDLFDIVSWEIKIFLSMLLIEISLWGW